MTMTSLPIGLSARAAPSKTGAIGMNVLDRQHARCRVEVIRGEKLQLARIGDFVTNLRRPTLAGGADEGVGGVDAGDLGAFALQDATEHALAAGEVDDFLCRLRIEQFQHAGQDDFAVILAAGFADELVVPVGDFAPVGF